MYGALVASNAAKCFPSIIPNMIWTQVNHRFNDTGSEIHDMITIKAICVELLCQLSSKAIGLKSIDERVDTHSRDCPNAWEEVQDFRKDFCTQVECRDTS